MNGDTNGPLAQISRRSVLAGTLALPAIARASGTGDTPMLPDRTSFDLRGVAFCDAASEHPIANWGRAALADYQLSRGPVLTPEEDRTEPVLAKFARLINADPDEVAYVQNTTLGEQLVLRSLGLPERGARIVTDTLHFFGSFPIYRELARQGCDVVWLRAKDGRIDPDEIERAITPGTRLIALSAVSTFNGFQHDVKRVCKIAHARGALVYADIIHAAGAVPFDVRACGVDFAACSSYKWLMGDYGQGFLFARKDRQHLLHRTQYGYSDALDYARYHVYPLDPPGTDVVDFKFKDGAMGYFAFGHVSFATVALLDRSLDYVQSVGPARINAYVQPMLQRLKSALPSMGYAVATPSESTAPMVTCVLPDAARLVPKLTAAGVRITTVRNRFRISLSVFNTMDDVERVLRALGPASRLS